jgi:hypothetical protein
MEYCAGALRHRFVEGDLVVDSSEETDHMRRVPLASIGHVRLYVAQGRGFCVLTPRGGRTLVITTPPGASTTTLRAYAEFVRELHRRLATAAPDAQLVAGHGAFFALHVVCMVSIVVYTMLFIAALIGGLDFTRLLPTMPTIVLPLLTLAKTSHSRPRPYSRGIVPASFLPAV